MAKRVFTGWRTVEPGPCRDCGCDSDYGCNGLGAVLCSCHPDFDESFDVTEAESSTESRGVAVAVHEDFEFPKLVFEHGYDADTGEDR